VEVPFPDELAMNFPSIYFKHNSTEYAEMPYPVDSCFIYIQKNIKDIKSYVIWRDSGETEQLSGKRVQKIRTDLSKYTKAQIKVLSMGKEQKISRYTINHNNQDSRSYLLSLNSVFDVYTTKTRKEMRMQTHIQRPRIWCWGCISSGFHFKARKKLKKIKREREKKSKQ
jgi:hypothetical protein